jgi:class 3 adenylate cyclase
LIEAQRRFVPSQFLDSLDHQDIARVDIGEHVAKTMSVMFADLRGFTSLAECLDPRSIIELLNRYFSIMAPQIRKRVVSSTRSRVMKSWRFRCFRGHAAVRAGIGMWRVLEEFNRRSVDIGQPQLQVGIA